MFINNWKLFDKSGSQIQWTPDSYINLKFDSATGKNAEGFLITDPSSLAIQAEITNSGYLYNDYPTLSYQYVFSDGEYVTINPSDASILFADVSIFNPNPTNTRSISGLSLDLSTNFVYPSVTYAGAIFLKPVSVGLIETEHLFILEDSSTNQIIRPYDPNNSTVIFQMIGDEDEISFFTVNEDTQEIIWTDILEYDLSQYVLNVPLSINIGFKSSEEGVFERKLRIIHQVNNINYTVAEILVNAEAIGEDERFKTLSDNFGFPDANNISKLFKEADINEDLIDYTIVNPKAKLMMLEHSNIMPFIGTYKGLVNAIKWLGYDDIYIREWFKNVKLNKKLSLIIPYDAKDRSQTILSFSSDERKVLKKLNQLSLNYCITRETGEIDEWGTPLTENCYSYNLQEVFIKLLSLKDWLERNIIGVNARIIDITGEGVYFERYKNLIYGTTNTGITANYRQSLTPTTINKSSELIKGDASINLTILELSKTKIEDLNYKFKDFIQYLYDASGNVFTPDDASLLEDPSILKVGAPLKYPFVDLQEIEWITSVRKTEAGTVTNEFVSKPLLILENDIRYYNIFDTSCHFWDASTNLFINLERAFLRDPSNDIWLDSSVFAIYPDPCDNSLFVMESSMGEITYFNGSISLNASTNASLDYNMSDVHFVPLLSFKNFKYTDSSGNTGYFIQDKEYYLDIIDGKISMDSSGNNEIYINFNYDTSLNEQEITLNAVYKSGRIPLYIIDPSIYYNNGASDPNVLIVDNSTYTMNVNHIGDYNVELFGFNGYNVPFYNKLPYIYNVFIKTPTIYTLIDGSLIDNNICSSTYLTKEDVSILFDNNKFPIYDRNIPVQGLTVEFDSSNGKPYVKIPSISYFLDIPEKDSINIFYNLTERCTSINAASKQIIFDADFQSFHTGDDIKLVKFDKGKYSLIQEVSTHALSVVGSIITVDNLPSGFTNFDSSSDIYLLNDTEHNTSNYNNDLINKTFTVDVSNYQFLNNQLINLIVTDNSLGYSWGGAYRILDVSGNTHILNANFPQQFLDASTRYTIKAKHSFSSFVTYTMNVNDATETNNFFNLYLDDNCTTYYLDNTFTSINIAFNQEIINDQWYDASDNLINNNFNFCNNPIEVDVSTLIILKAVYDNSTYLLNQKNIWTIKRNLDKSILFKVFNESVPYIFNEEGYYDVEIKSYDIYGNLSSKNYEGLIKIK